MATRKTDIKWGGNAVELEGAEVKVGQKAPDFTALGNDMKPGSIKGLQLVVDDVEAAHAQLAERGVAVSPVSHFEGATLVEGRGGPWNSFIFFDDPDGTSWAVQGRPRGEGVRR